MSIETNQTLCHKIHKTPPSTVEMNGENGEVK